MMIKPLLTILLCCFTLGVFAQMNISTNLRQDAIWDEKSEEWLILATDEDELTFFEFNEEFTMFKHTTASITSAYIIKSSSYDEKRDQYEMDIVSDVGNKYLMIIDPEGENVRFLYEREGDMLMVQHTIKNIWFEEED